MCSISFFFGTYCWIVVVFVVMISTSALECHLDTHTHTIVHHATIPQYHRSTCEFHSACLQKSEWMCCPFRWWRCCVPLISTGPCGLGMRQPRSACQPGGRINTLHCQRRCCEGDVCCCEGDVCEGSGSRAHEVYEMHVLFFAKFYPCRPVSAFFVTNVDLLVRLPTC